MVGNLVMTQADRMIFLQKVSLNWHENFCRYIDESDSTIFSCSQYATTECFNTFCKLTKEKAKIRACINHIKDILFYLNLNVINARDWSIKMRDELRILVDKNKQWG